MKRNIAIIGIYVLVIWIHFVPQLVSLYQHYYVSASSHWWSSTKYEGGKFFDCQGKGKPISNFDWVSLMWGEGIVRDGQEYCVEIKSSN